MDPQVRSVLGAQRAVFEKTVRNHAKLGVWSRAQAIVFARDHHFNG